MAPQSWPAPASPLHPPPPVPLSPWDSAPVPPAGTSSGSWPPGPGRRRCPQARPPKTGKRSGAAPPGRARWGRRRGRAPHPRAAPPARGVRSSPHPHAGPADPTSPGLLFARGGKCRGRVTRVEGEGNKNFFKKEQMTSFSSGRLCPTWTISWGLWWNSPAAAGSTRN